MPKFSGTPWVDPPSIENIPATVPAGDDQLLVSDRCDRCGAQAFVRAIWPNLRELLFCAHHGRKYAKKLRDDGADVIDQSWRLVDGETGPRDIYSMPDGV